MNSLSLETLIHSSSRALVIGVGGDDVVGALAFRFLLDTLGEDRVVFGSDYCGGLGAVEKALPVIEQQSDPARIKRSPNALPGACSNCK